jgi:hypothetical protein
MFRYISYVFTALGPKKRERRKWSEVMRHLTHYRVNEQQISFL